MMNYSRASARSLVIYSAICVLVVLISDSVTGNPLQQDKQSKPAINDDLLPMGADGSLFLAGNECGPNETLRPGALPTCEPTCRNPRPVCPKVFFESLDFVPCLCNKGLVRNEETKQCIPPSQCPVRGL